MYELTLTHDERHAIGWIGHRYSNGDDLHHLLMDGSVNWGPDETTDWDDPNNITFHVPEFIAWQIAENAANEDGDLPYNFPGFSTELTIKMLEFCECVV